jgi:hypothetical protein
MLASIQLIEGNLAKGLFFLLILLISYNQPAQVNPVVPSTLEQVPTLPQETKPETLPTHVKPLAKEALNDPSHPTERKSPDTPHALQASPNSQQYDTTTVQSSHQYTNRNTPTPVLTQTQNESNQPTERISPSISQPLQEISQLGYSHIAAVKAQTSQQEISFANIGPLAHQANKEPVTEPQLISQIAIQPNTLQNDDIFEKRRLCLIQFNGGPAVRPNFTGGDCVRFLLANFPDDLDDPANTFTLHRTALSPLDQSVALVMTNLITMTSVIKENSSPLIPTLKTPTVASSLLPIKHVQFASELTTIITIPSRLDMAVFTSDLYYSKSDNISMQRGDPNHDKSSYYACPQLFALVEANTKTNTRISPIDPQGIPPMKVPRLKLKTPMHSVLQQSLEQPTLHRTPRTFTLTF